MIAGVKSRDSDVESDWDEDSLDGVSVNSSLLDVNSQYSDDKANRWFDAPIFEEIKEDLEKDLATIPLSERELRKQRLRKQRDKKERENKKRLKKTREGFAVIANAVAGMEDGSIAIVANTNNNNVTIESV